MDVKIVFSSYLQVIKKCEKVRQHNLEVLKFGTLILINFRKSPKYAKKISWQKS